LIGETKYRPHAAKHSNYNKSSACFISVNNQVEVITNIHHEDRRS
jgi:hypothetical protein